MSISITHHYNQNTLTTYSYLITIIYLMQHTHLILLICSLLIIHVLAVQQPYKLVVNDIDPNARCLDGSYPAFYLHQGGDRTKLLVFFVGGGYCGGANTQEVLEECYQRTQGERGTSKVLAPQLISPGGYLSTDPANSRFAKWTKIIIEYCDGSQHQGHNNQPIAYKDKLLYFRGADNTRAHFKWLQIHYNLSDAERVLLTGASAGAIATIYWSNYMRSLLKNPEGLAVIADSGLYANASLPNTNTHQIDVTVGNLFKVSNIDEKSPIEACNQKYKGEEYKCILAQYSYEFLQNKILFINSEYDEVGLTLTLNAKCMKVGVSGLTLKYCNQTEMSYIQGYRSLYMDIVKLLIANGHSFWTIACCRHSYACYKELYNVQRQKIPMMNGDAIEDAVNRFVFDRQRVLDIDYKPWPSNEPCAF